MMRIGCCINLSSAFQDADGPEAIPRFAELGFDYLEFPLVSVAELADAAYRELLGKVRSGGLPVEACNVSFPGGFRLTGGEARHEEAINYFRLATGRAAELGVKVIVLGSSGARNVPSGFPHEKAWEQFKALLCKLHEVVKPLGITIAVEPLNRTETNFITTAADGLKLVQELSLDYIKLIIDYFHMRMEDEAAAIVTQAGPALAHIHIAAKEGRRYPRRGDGENYREFFDLLTAAGYRGRVSIEGSSEAPVVDAAEALKVLRPLTASVISV
ncbi:MAG: sugar phosphate isomerase/epimerase [Treponema sp.]|jgi:sugar phosphate isomerase/epimerase|nr:sugar phosphate isomerase/epimerase [Treponema sp.]